MDLPATPSVSIPEFPIPQRDEPESWPFYGEDEVAAVAEVLRSGKVNQWTGDRVRAFERALAHLSGVEHAIAVANGSVALELALRVHGIGAGDEVIVTPRSFIASASSADLVGAIPVFADVDAHSQNISPETIEPCIGPRTRAIIPVHLAGWPCDMPGIMALAARHNLIVIEDCAQAIGARINGRPVGSFGHAGTHSFCQDKIISTGGEGGAIVFREAHAWQLAWSYKDHGKSWDAVMAPSNGQASYRWLHESIGTNLRMTEIQAAIGIVQITKLNRWLDLRRRNAAIWLDALCRLDCLALPQPPGNVQHAYYKLYTFVKPERLQPGVDRDSLLRALTQAGIRAFFGSCPEIYLEKAYAARAIEPLPVARQLGQTSLMFEIHPTLREQTVRVAAARAAEIIHQFQRD